MQLRSNPSWRARALALGVIAAAAIAPLAAPAQQPKTLRVTMHADVRTLDPFWTTQTIAGIHGLMVYDTLFSSDIDLKPKPQMVDTWNVSDDRKVYTFTLRDGLKFHDGSPVTTKDVIASMNRWGKRDTAGKTLFGHTASLTARDDKTFVWTLTEPYGLLIDFLAKIGTNIPFVMREKEAMVDPFQQIQEVVGSGPYAFKRDEWVPGSKTVYVKFRDYMPRKEPASGHAGGKVVKVDRVEFVWLSDPQTAQAALVAGEIDYLENPQPDFLPILENTPGIKIESHPAMGTMGIVQMNHLHPPFNNVKARQALLYIINNADYLNTIAADKKLQTLCFSLFGCGVDMETDAGSEAYKGPKDYKKAEQLFKEAGYNGEPITILQATDHQYITPAGLVLTQQLRRAGFLKLDIQSMDWG
ncbi:MAG: ABC transporter substrate-binding protein, partial [Alphaproteobacteria bacterium]|nr:ABC transporter substrate-binding protein [Alphaproteobacteria bacterium]